MVTHCSYRLGYVPMARASVKCCGFRGDKRIGLYRLRKARIGSTTLLWRGAHVENRKHSAAVVTFAGAHARGTCSTDIKSWTQWNRKNTPKHTVYTFVAYQY